MLFRSSTMPNTDIAAVPNYQLFSPDCVGSHPSLHLALIPSIPSSIHSSLLSSSISSPHPFIPRSISPYIQVSPCILSYPSFLPLSIPPFIHHSLIHAFLLFVFFPVILLSIHPSISPSLHLSLPPSLPPSISQPSLHLSSVTLPG